MGDISECFEIAARDKNFIADCKAKGEVFPSHSQAPLERCVWAAAHSGYVLGKYGPEHARDLVYARKAGAKISFDGEGKPVPGMKAPVKTPWWQLWT